MRRSSPKKPTERRKKPRSKPSAKVKAVSRGAEPGSERNERVRPKGASGAVASQATDQCKNCSTNLVGSDRAVFVEEEVGRIFCSESCITEFFGADIDRLEKEYFKKLPKNELSADERERLNHLRWVTLQEPDEIWREKTLAGDYRYYLISEYRPGNERIWCVCICLFLRGEPSFLYLAFPTRSEDFVQSYRRGERVERVATPAKFPPLVGEKHEAQEAAEGKEGSDRLADAWTEDETMRAQLVQDRSLDDIPADEFALYQSCLEETLESPDEVWSLRLEASEGEGEGVEAQEASDPEMGDNDAKVDGKKLYHFIRYYPDENPGVWFIIIARETEDEEQIEILDAFPSRDPKLVERYRRGDQEVGPKEPVSSNRVVH